MRRIFLVAIIPLIALSLSFLYIAQRQAMDQDEGNGIYHLKKREQAVLRVEADKMSGYSNPLKRGAYGETTDVSGPLRKDRLEEVIEDCVRAIKNLATRFGHRTRPSLAPPGVYFTLLHLDIRNPSGVTGLSAGTRVVCVKDDGAVLLVKMGNLEFEAKRQYLTNNLDIADLAARNDAEAQQAVASTIAQQQAMDQTRRHQENAALAQAQQEIAARRAAAEAPWGVSSLNRGAYDQTTDVSGPPSVGEIILPQFTLTKSANLAVPTPAPIPK